MKGWSWQQAATLPSSVYDRAVAMLEEDAKAGNPDDDIFD
jgi:hypothetical protein